MLKYRYYIVNPEMGDVYGTNDEVKAEEYSQDDSCYVIDAEEAQLIQVGTVGERFDIQRIPE